MTLELTSLAQVW